MRINIWLKRRRKTGINRGAIGMMSFQNDQSFVGVLSLARGLRLSIIRLAYEDQFAGASISIWNHLRGLKFTARVFHFLDPFTEKKKMSEPRPVPRRESPWGMPEGEHRQPKPHRCNDRAEDVIQVRLLSCIFLAFFSPSFDHNRFWVWGFDFVQGLIWIEEIFVAFYHLKVEILSVA